MLGLCYFNGFGINRDTYEAIYLFTKASERGSDKASYVLGELYYNGVDVKKDIKRATEYFKKAALFGNTDAKNAIKNLEL
jgi:TPR repeat protein